MGISGAQQGRHSAGQQSRRAWLVLMASVVLAAQGNSDLAIEEEAKALLQGPWVHSLGWTSAVSTCQWAGVKCSNQTSEQRVVELCVSAARVMLRSCRRKIMQHGNKLYMVAREPVCAGIYKDQTFQATCQRIGASYSTCSRSVWPSTTSQALCPAAGAVCHI